MFCSERPTDWGISHPLCLLLGFSGQEWRELRGLAASIMYDHSQVLFESRGVEHGERAFDAKQVDA